MSSQFGCICSEDIELKFYPQYNEMDWPAQWVEDLGGYICQSYHIVSDYAPLTGCPEIIIVQKQYVAEILKKAGLPEWVSAFTIEGTIYTLFDDKNARWKFIIDHEMFHARVNMFLGSETCLPVWLNEGIAYYIGKNSVIDVWKLYEYTVEHFETVYGWIEKDQLLSSQNDMRYEIVKSLGAYICKTYGAGKIKSLIEKIKKVNRFEMALSEAFGIDLPALVNRWHDDLLRDLSRFKKGRKGLYID